MRLISADRTAALLGTLDDRSPAYSAIADGLRLLIGDGRVPPGTRLPSERELTTTLGVSRTTVTRAYAVLRDSGYLESRRGSGSVTRLPSRAQVRDTLLDPDPIDSGVIDLGCAAPTAPPGVMSAYEAALEQLPQHLCEAGYYPSGLPRLRAAIASRYAERGLPTDPEQILVTSGALAALAVAVRAFVDVGDRVLTESPTYPNALGTLRGAGARLSGAHIDYSGWAASGVTEAVRQLRPSSAYLMPDFHNPTGLLMDDDQRGRLAEALSRARTLPLVDETMVATALDDAPAPLPFAAHAPRTISLGSASKEFWSGLRIGWLRSPDSGMATLVASRLTLDLGAPVLEQLALLHLMERSDAVRRERRRRLLESRAALVGALAERLPSWCYRLAAGGLSLWCELPRPVSSALAATALGHGVRLAAGPQFAPEGGLERFVRLPFTQPPDALREAVDRIGQAWDELPTRALRHRRLSDRRGTVVA